MSIKNRITRLENHSINQLGYDPSFPVYSWISGDEPPPKDYPGLIIQTRIIRALDKNGNPCGNDEAVTVETQYPDRVERMPWGEWRESQACPVNVPGLL